jgi:hypothetical protein
MMHPEHRMTAAMAALDPGYGLRLSFRQNSLSSGKIAGNILLLPSHENLSGLRSLPI